MMRIRLSGALAVAALGGCFLPEEGPPGPDASLIPRDVLFGNPERQEPQISPDGKQISFLAPAQGVLNVWVMPVEDFSKARLVTNEAQRGIRTYAWAYTSNHILYLQDEAGDENWRLVCVDLTTGDRKTLTPERNVQAQIQELSPAAPQEILIRLNDRDPKYHDLYRVNILTGQRTLIVKNEGFQSFLTDDALAVRFATRTTPEGGTEILEADGKGWKSFATLGMEDALTTRPFGFDKSGSVLYIIDSRGRDTAALLAFDLRNGSTRTLAADDRSDIVAALMHPTHKTIEAVATEHTRRIWKFLDPGIGKEFERLRAVLPGTEVRVVDRSLDDRHWIVEFAASNRPTRFYYYDRAKKEPRYLFTDRPELEGATLATMHPVVIPARDGLELASYLTLPIGAAPARSIKPRQPLPMVLLVHGGPWARDRWGFNPFHQWLSDRGYAVLSVNFRGSVGFGKTFLNASTGQWGGTMQDDLIDAVSWAIDEGIADKDKVAIMGGSYGGYAVLVGLTMTPDVFACGVDIVGPSNLVTLLTSIPPHLASLIEVFAKRVGDHRTTEGRAFLTSRSPLTYVERIKKPLLIVQGANDPRVKRVESDEIVRALEGKRIPVTYLVYTDEGHGFGRPVNALSFNAIAEAFLAQHLGGRYQPIGDDLRGSSLLVPAGSDDIPGMIAALRAAGR